VFIKTCDMSYTSEETPDDAYRQWIVYVSGVKPVGLIMCTANQWVIINYDW
jgi:hypothetical protein